MSVDQPDRKALLVIGMHRSGTSAMARVLSLAGAALPAELMPATRSNEAGHWEPMAVANLNDQMLATIDSRWDSVFGPRRNRKGALPLTAHLEEARRIIREQYAEQPLIVLKEPRVTLLVDFWEQALKAEGYQCAYLIMVRKPEEVAASLRARDQINETHSLLLWSTYMSQADLLTRHAKRIFCTYDRLLDEPESVLEDVEERLGVELPRRTSKASAQIARFLEPRLRHHASSRSKVLPAPLQPITRLAEYYFDLAAGNHPNDDAATAARDWLGALDTVVSPLLAGWQVQAEEALAGSHAEQEVLELRAAAAEARLQSLQLENEALSRTVEERAAATADLAHSLAELGALLQQTETAWQVRVDGLEREKLEGENARVELDAQLQVMCHRYEVEAAARAAERAGRLEAEAAHLAEVARAGRFEADARAADELIARLRVELAALEDERTAGIDRANESRLAHEAATAELTAQIDDREQSLAELAAERDWHASNAAAAAAALQAREAELLSAQEQIAAGARSIKALEDRDVHRIGEVDAAHGALAALRSEFEQREQAAAQASAQQEAALQGAVETLQAEIAAAYRRLEELADASTAELAAGNAQLQDLREQADRARRKVHELEAESTDRGLELAKARERAEHLQAASIDADAEIERLRAELTERHKLIAEQAATLEMRGKSFLERARILFLPGRSP